MTDAIRWPIPEQVADMAIAGHHVVEASAGTGKTHLIEHRAVDLLIRGGATIDQLLIVTFTDKATAELRRRLRGLIAKVASATEHRAAESEPHWVIDDDVRARLTAARIGFDRASISTIHGFCQRVITDSALATKRPFEQSQIANETAFAEAFNACLRERFAVDGDLSRYLEQFLANGRSVDALRELLSTCSRRGGRIVPRIDEAALAAALIRMDGAVRASEPELVDSLAAAGVRKNSAKAQAWRLRALAEIGARHMDHGDIVQSLGALDRANIDIAKLFGDLPADRPELKAAAGALLSSAAPLSAAIAERFLPIVQDRMEQVKARRGLFDFQDMLELCWRALSGPRGDRVTRRLRERYPFALIDEFQDTDPIQWQIFSHVYLDAPKAYLTVVGDPKQAIYSFRGADVHTYLRAASEMLERGASRTSLRVNYRSTPGLVAGCNELVGGDYFSGGIRYDEPVEAGVDVRAIDADGDDVAPIELLHVPFSGTKLKVDQLRKRLATRIVEEISSLLGDENRLRVGPPGNEQPIRPRDIFVLTRSVVEAEHIAARLRAAAVPCALYKQEGLFQSDEALEVRDLLAAIAEPRSRSARLRAWNTRFFSDGLGQLSELGRSDETDPRIGRLYEWKSLADRLAYEQLLSRILSDTRLVERELLCETSERSLTNILHLFELLLEATLQSRREIHELVALLSHWMADTAGWDGGDRNLQRLESELSAVQIMTVHKAKGLEAPVVFLYGGFGRPRTDEVQIVHEGGERCLAVGKGLGHRRDAARDEARAEDERLLYVAITRAIGRLYLPSVDPAAFAIAGAYEPLKDRATPLTAIARPDLFSVADLGAETGGKMSTAGRDLAGWRPALQEPDGGELGAELAAIRQHQRGFSVTSYTRLKASAGRARPPIEPSDFKADVDTSGVELSDDDLPGGRETGIYLHHLLEHVPLSSVLEAADFDAWRSSEKIDGLFCRAQRRYARDPRHRAPTERLVYRALTTEIDAEPGRIPGLAVATRAATEMEFLYPLAGERVFVKGFIDLVCEVDGRVYVVDWKSDVLGDYSAGALESHVADHYAIQGTLYSIALSRMLELSGDPGKWQARFGGVIYCFLRASAFLCQRPTLDDLSARETELSGALS